MYFAFALPGLMPDVATVFEEDQRATLRIRRGHLFSESWRIEDPSGEPVDLTPHDYSLEFFSPAGVFLCRITLTKEDPEAGLLSLELSPAFRLDPPFEEGSWQIIEQSEFKPVFLEGRFVIDRL